MQAWKSFRSAYTSLKAMRCEFESSDGVPIRRELMDSLTISSFLLRALVGDVDEEKDGAIDHSAVRAEPLAEVRHV